MPNVETVLLVVIGLVVLFVVVAMLRDVRIVPQSYTRRARLLHPADLHPAGGDKRTS